MTNFPIVEQFPPALRDAGEAAVSHSVSPADLTWREWAAYARVARARSNYYAKTNPKAADNAWCAAQWYIYKGRIAQHEQA